MKRFLSFVCVALLASSPGGFASAAVLAEFTARGTTTSSLDNTDFDQGLAGTSGTVSNFISGPGTAINNTNYPTPGTAPVITGSLNFVTQLDGAASWDEFRLRRQTNALNPESGGFAYTQLFWSDASTTQPLAADTTFEFAYSNNLNTGTVRAAVRDTGGQWYLSAGSETNNTPDENVPFSLNLGTETWALYTPATPTSSSLLLAPPNTEFTATPGAIDAFGFFLEDLTPEGNGRWRINSWQVTGTVAAIPEPGSFALCGLASLGLISRRRR